MNKSNIATRIRARMEENRHQANLMHLEKEEKKAVHTNDRNKLKFLQALQSKRQDWWKADEKYRETVKRTFDIQPPPVQKPNANSKIRPVSSINFLNDYEEKEVLSNSRQVMSLANFGNTPEEDNRKSILKSYDRTASSNEEYKANGSVTQKFRSSRINRVFL